MLGVNGGNQINVFVFEVGFITESPEGVRTVQTIGVHPLVVAPTTISYTDATRSSATQTDGSSLFTRAGRALPAASIAGTFGVVERGVGVYFGTGERRFQRFWKEVVDMPDARDRATIDSLIDPINGSIGLRARLAGFKPGSSTFFVNFYDFLNDKAFQVNIKAFVPVRQFRNAGATGLVSYTLTIEGVGDIVRGGPVTLLIERLLAGLTTWTSVNQAIRSYNPVAVGESLTAFGTIPASIMLDTINSLITLSTPVINLMGGSPSPARASTARASTALTQNARAAASGQAGQAIEYFAAASSLQRQAAAAARAILASSTGVPDEVSGAIDWSVLVGEGDLDELFRFESVTELREVEDAAAWQGVAGVLFGMSREEYVSYMTAQASGGRAGPVYGGSIVHIVTDTDTSDAIASTYSVSWPTVLDANALTPDEALRVGTSLRIPILRPRGPQPITGLPTFGSHLGQSAWGVDIDVNGGVGPDGRPILMSGPDVLEQGMLILLESEQDQLGVGLDNVPAVAQASYLTRRLRSMLATDPRIASVEEIAITTDDSGAGFHVECTVTAINGGTIRTGGAAP